MTEQTIEDVYTALALGIDAQDPDKAEMFLAKVCLLLAQELDDPDRTLNLIKEAQRNMKGMRTHLEGA